MVSCVCADARQGGQETMEMPNMVIPGYETDDQDSGRDLKHEANQLKQSSRGRVNNRPMIESKSCGISFRL